MYSLRTFGTLALTRDGTPLGSVGTHRNALAVLAVLASDGTASRDRLMALLWPDSDTARARGSLKQAIHFLRHSLEAPELLLGRNELALNPALIESDVRRFRDALAVGDLVVAVVHYRGRFLDGVHLGASRELEDWADARRRALAAEYAGALARLAGEAERRGDLNDAVEWWRRLQAHEPLDGRVALQLMRALAASGQRTAALQHARAHALLLRAELDLAPDSAVTELAGQLRRTMAAVERVADDVTGPELLDQTPVHEFAPGTPPAGTPPAGTPPAGTPPAGTVPAGTVPAGTVPVHVPHSVRNLNRRRAFAGAAVLLGLVLALAAYGRRGVTEEGPIDANLVAVAPFDVVDPSLQLWHEGLTRVLAQNLDGAGPLRTVPPTVALRRWAGAADEPSARRLGARTGAGIVIFGSVVRRGIDSIGIRASVLDRTRGSSEPYLEVSGEEHRIGELADSLGVRILRVLGRSRPIASVRHVSIGARSLPALREFLRGEQFYRLGAWDSALARYDRAIAEDSTFALALRRMAWSLGMGASSSWRYDSQAHYFRRAVALNHGLSPRDSVLLLGDSLALFGLGAPTADELLASRFGAVRILESLARSYPEDPAIWYELGERRAHGAPPLGGFPGPALEAFDRAIVLDPGFAPAYMHAVRLALQVGRADRAAEYARAYAALNPQDVNAPALRLVAAIFDSGGVHAPGVWRQVQAAAANTLVWSGLEHLRWWTDSAETAVVLLGELVRGQHDPSGTQRFAADSLMWRQYHAGALAFRGHLREAVRTNARLIAAPEASPYSSDFDPFVDLALFGALDDATARRAFDRGLARHTPWTGGNTASPPRHLRGLPWWFARADTGSIARFGRRAAEVARGTAPPIAVLRGRYFEAASGAYLALLHGDSATAERRFVQIPDSLCLVGGCFPEKLMLARLLAARGNDRRAAEILDSWQTAGEHRPSAVLAALERARIAERLGDAVTAAERYGFVLDAWRHPDGELRGFVEEARAGLARATRMR